jgi:hypothetical protein
VVPERAVADAVARGVSIALALATAACLGLVGTRRREGARVFWTGLALGPLVFAGGRLLRSPLLSGLCELPWAVVLLPLLASSRPRATTGLRGRTALWIGAYGAALVAVAAWPVLQPAAHRSPALEAFMGGSLRLLLAFAAATLSARATLAEEGQSSFARLALGLALWSVGASVAGYVRAVQGSLRLSEMGVIFPLLFLSGLALGDLRRGRREMAPGAETGSRHLEARPGPAGLSPQEDVR